MLFFCGVIFFHHHKTDCMSTSISYRIAAKTLALLAVCATIFSFSTYRGAHSFRVYLNDKIVLEQYVGAKEGAKTFELGKANYNDKLSVYYNECGQVGKGRSIAIRDENNKTLKEWRFADASSLAPDMSCKVGEILDLQKNKGGKLQLFYSSKVLPEGQLLAAIAVNKEGKSTR
jgi:hypothetical protein